MKPREPYTPVEIAFTVLLVLAAAVCMLIVEPRVKTPPSGVGESPYAVPGPRQAR